MDTCKVYPVVVSDAIERNEPKRVEPVETETPPLPPPPPQNNNEIVKPKSGHIIKNIKTHITRKTYNNIGQVLYQFPDTMTLYKVYNITVRISKDTNLSEVVLTDLSSNQEIKRSKIQVGSYMLVELKNDIEIDPHFNITKINSVKQELDTLLYTTWNFRVEPIRSGESQLNLVISVINGENIKEIVYSDKILIKNNIKKNILIWWETEWKWAFSTIIIPIFIFLWKKLKNKKEI
jgi:ribosomal protein L20A (L18A)